MVVPLDRDAFLIGHHHDVARVDQAGSRVMVEGGDAEDLHPGVARLC